MRCNRNHCHVTGILSLSQLSKSDWWKQPGVSLLLYPDGVIQNYEPQKETSDQYFGFVEQLVEIE